MIGLLKLVLPLQHEMNGPAAGALEEFSATPAGHHVADPSGGYEYVLVVVGVLITVLVAVLTVKYFVRPGEAGSGHIKRRVLADER